MNIERTKELWLTSHVGRHYGWIARKKIEGAVVYREKLVKIHVNGLMRKTLCIFKYLQQLYIYIYIYLS